MVKKIALEEHFLDPATEPYWQPTMVDVAPQKTAQLYGALTDFGEQRLAMMDKTGIARAVLAVAGPGVQAERDAATAVRAARASNDFLAKEVQKRPERYSGFAQLAMQDAKAAADELERCVRELKFCGAMINGHTNGKYLDDRSLRSVLGARRRPGRADLSASGRPGGANSRRSPATTCWRVRCGAGAWKPARTRCASSAAACSIATRKPS